MPLKMFLKSYSLLCFGGHFQSETPGTEEKLDKPDVDCTAGMFFTSVQPYTMNV